MVGGRNEGTEPGSTPRMAAIIIYGPHLTHCVQITQVGHDDEHGQAQVQIRDVCRWKEEFSCREEEVLQGRGSSKSATWD